MQVVGATLGTFVVCYLVLESARIYRQRLRSQILREMSFELLRQQINYLKTQQAHFAELPGPWKGYRTFVVKQIIEETSTTASFYLAPKDGQPLPPFQAGQFLTFQINIPGQAKPVLRCYTISSSPNTEFYRITVKKVPDGTASVFLHEHLSEGSQLQVKAPAGKFHIEPVFQKRSVFIAGGAGVTPFMSMVAALAEANSQCEVQFFYAMKNSDEYIFKNELQELSAKYDNLKIHVIHSHPHEDDVQGRDYDFSGRLSVELLQQHLTTNQYNFYLCGPKRMVKSLQTGLLGWDVPNDNLFSEAFGSEETASETETTLQVVEPKKHPKPTTDEEKATVFVPTVTFAKSGRTEIWDSTATDLLCFADQNGIQIESVCGSGNCGACQTAIKSGKVKYQEQPGFQCDEQKCLPCMAIPDGDLVLNV